MRVIILAAGRGSRFGGLTDKIPKCMLRVCGVSILERQISFLKKTGVTDIYVIRSYKKEAINIEGVNYVDHEPVDKDMVYSLFQAKELLHGDVLIVYGDILYDKSIFENLNALEGLSVICDSSWQNYFMLRFGEKMYDDLESLVIRDGKIVKIGMKNPKPSDIDAQYFGMTKLDDASCKILCDWYDSEDRELMFRGKQFDKLQMTDLFQLLIDKGFKLKPYEVKKGWVEFDGISDISLVERKEKDNSLSEIINWSDVNE